MSAETDRRTMDVERKRELARERYARFIERKRDGVVVLGIVVDRGWWAEALSRCGGFVHPDEDNQARLEEGTQAFADLIIEKAKEERLTRLRGADVPVSEWLEFVRKRDHDEGADGP